MVWLNFTDNALQIFLVLFLLLEIQIYSTIFEEKMTNEQEILCQMKYLRDANDKLRPLKYCQLKVYTSLAFQVTSSLNNHSYLHDALWNVPIEFQDDNV